LILVQRLASGAVSDVLAGRNLDQVLRKIWSQQGAALTPGERGAIQDISFGSLRWYGELKAILDKLVARPIKDTDVATLLIIALFQLRHSKAADHAVVDHAVRTVAALGKPQFKGLVNGILRNFLRQSEALVAQIQQDPVAHYSYPVWWAKKIQAQYPERWESILAAGNDHPPMTLRVNLRKSGVDEYLKRLKELDIAATPLDHAAISLTKPISVERLPGFAEGVVSVQDYAAQQAAYLLDLVPGLRVLDACAAPGGKTAHLLESADLQLTAIDKDAERMTQVTANLSRLGLDAVMKTADANKLDHWWDGVPFDRVLCDAPCTASGVVKRHPDIKWLRRESDVARFAQQQAQLLAALWPTLTPGGKLLYATCSIFAEENHRQVADFCRNHPDAVLQPIPEGDQHGLQLLPSAMADGFFYSLLQKR
jgi:16S rRNA (cytosine967-C5)-methyltransferase